MKSQVNINSREQTFDDWVVAKAAVVEKLASVHIEELGRPLVLVSD